MKVIYDISVLGIGHVSQHNRAGIYRVVQNLAEYLSCSPDIELYFSATEYHNAYHSLNLCLEYLKNNPSFRNVELPHSI